MVSASGPPNNLGLVIAPTGPKNNGNIKMMQMIQSHQGIVIFVFANMVFLSSAKSSFVSVANRIGMSQPHGSEQDTRIDFHDCAFEIFELS